MNINPIKLIGNWDEGYALDFHVVSSVYLGIDEYGHDQYDNKRSYIGELLYQYKYKNMRENIDKIMDLVKPFLGQYIVSKSVDIIISAPSSNKNRKYQPAVEIAREIAKYLNILFIDKVLIKKTDEQSKNMDKSQKKISGTIVAAKRANKPYNLLLVDDLYSTGATLKECVKVLKEDINCKNIIVLTMTKTR